jgi:thiol-disulfide isomerase/thioredoxin
MVYVVVALVVLSALTLLNLLLFLGVMRRLREHSELLSKGAGNGGADNEGLLAAGETVADFTATTVDGDAVGLADLRDGAMVAFFSPTCAPCRERLPEFVEAATAVPAADRQAYAVIIGDAAEAAGMAEQLSPAARVVTGPTTVPMVEAFGAESFPALYRMGPDGVVAASGHTLAVYPALATA